ncbi:MAG: hypothetical protein QW717_03555 [Candidatus Bathyarchaeia archaeon]
MNLEEILAAAAKIQVCPKCSSKEGFWLAAKRNQAYVQCKGCGASFELYEVFNLNEKFGKKSPHKHLKIFGK